MGHWMVAKKKVMYRVRSINLKIGGTKGVFESRG